MAKKLIIWDFDATLAYRLNPWSSSAKEFLDETMPNHGLATEAIRRQVLAALPWENPKSDHRTITDRAMWWEHVGARIGRGLYGGLLKGVSCPTDFIPVLRKKIFDPLKYTLLDDCLSVLATCKSLGYEQIILSNNAPDVKELADELGIGAYMSHVLAAASVGHYKPDAAIYKHALDAAGAAAEDAQMIGDNYEADILGAERIGVRAIHYCQKESKAKRVVKNLREIPGLLNL